MGKVNHSLSVKADTVEITLAESKMVNKIVYNGRVFSPVALIGEWIPENARPKSSQFVCSICRMTAYDPQPNRKKIHVKRCRYQYCPNCGAYMRRDRDE